ncbi:MAG: M20 family metallopeptidase [Rhodospirillales bacterium]|jgi:succinyl-diaminopimelate desuccinylase|nr:M20 family metallopeptidase [Rhodospirillales bacterium]MDP7652956.1 M20 family metallopeptidase [Rhodospirillales bacterium]|tara:strand:- start:301 stop:1431 length:1131 start_codon:yes stop_codon:yes gene_type:complete
MPESLGLVELTRTLVAFETINPPGNERPCAEHLGGLLEDGGFFVSYHDFADTRTSLVARIGGASDTKPLCFTGHIDVVPLGAAPWSVDPFAGEIADGKLYGRGTTDMKSGVAAFVVAGLNLAKDFAKGPGVVLVITAGEETGCEGAYHLAGLGDVLGEAGAIVVAEPTSNQPWIGHKGALWLKARTTGVTAHGSMPEQGDNAVYKAARAIGQLEDFDFNIARHQVLGKPTLNVGSVHGGLNINSVPDLAEVGIDIRTILDQDHAILRSQLTGYLGEDVELESVVDVGGVLTDPADEWMQEVHEIMTEILDGPPESRTAPYFTDASALTPAYGGPPTVILGPGEAVMAHQTDEYCLVNKIGEARDAYIEIASRWNAR